MTSNTGLWPSSTKALGSARVSRQRSVSVSSRAERAATISSIVRTLPSASTISASAVRHFPMLGLPATMMRSDGCSPAVSASRSAKPVGTPVTACFCS